MGGLPAGALTFATDGSAKTVRGPDGREVAAGCAVVQGGPNGPELLVRLRGRPQEISVSYYAELAGLIVLHHVAPDGAQHTWVGDNESVVTLYKRIAWEGWVFTEQDLEDMPARALVRWLIKLVAERRVPFIAQHQVSHLSVATAEQRRSDYRVLLARADAAAERARGSHGHTLNISGSHPGVDDLGVYEHDGLAGGRRHTRSGGGQVCGGVAGEMGAATGAGAVPSSSRQGSACYGLEPWRQS